MKIPTGLMNQVTRFSQSDLCPDYGVPYFWEGLSKWIGQSITSRITCPQDMIDNRVVYICEEAGDDTGSLYNEIVSKYLVQKLHLSNVTKDFWGMGRTKRKTLAVVDNETIGIDVELYTLSLDGTKHKVLRVMSPECVCYLLLLN